MFRIFKRQNDDADVVARQVSPTKSAPASTIQSEKVSDDTLLDLVTALSKANGVNVVLHGARLMVIGELLVSVLTHLPGSLQASIVESFRNRIEGLMSLSDDRSLPEQYHSALLAEVNRYLNALR